MHCSALQAYNTSVFSIRTKCIVGTFLLFFLFVVIPLPAQYRFDVWNIENGLPDNTVNDIAQTPDGYLWLGTQRGVVRFDGFQFTLFDMSNTKELLNNAVSTLFCDKEGALWIGTGGGGMTRYKDGIFKTYTAADGLSSNFISRIVGSKDGSVWAATPGGGLTRFRDGQFIHYTTANGLSGNFVSDLFEDREGNLWIGTNGGGLNKFSHNEFSHVTVRNGLPDNFVKGVYGDTDGSLWVGTSSGLAHFKNGRVQRYTTSNGLPHNFVISFAEDKERGLWIGTYGGGISRFDGKKFKTYRAEDGLSSNFVLCMYQDREGNLWIGTERGGLTRIKRTSLRTFTTDDGLSMDYIRSVFQDRSGALWMGTNGGGVNRYVMGRFTSFTKRDGLSSDFVRPVYEDRSGNLWIGTWGGGVNVQKKGAWKQYTTKQGLANDFIRAFLQDHRGAVWIGTNGGGVSLFEESKFTTLGEREGLSNNFVSTIIEDGFKNIWIGTSGGGLNRYRDGSLTIYNTGNGLSNNFVTAIHEEGDGTLWIGTNGGGLNRMKDGKFSHIRAKDGLYDDVIFQILEDDGGNFWFTSNRGIFRVGKEQLKNFADGKINSVGSMWFGKTDGMRTSECSGGCQPAGWKTMDGMLWFPTVQGLVMLNPSTVGKDLQPTLVHIEKVMVDKTLREQHALAELAPGGGELEFHYTGIAFDNPAKIQFQYKLEGFDKDWVDAGGRRTAFYTNVPPGQFTFTVRATNANGAWSEHVASTSLTLLPPFWRTAWFRILAGIVSIGLIAGAVRYISTRKLQRELHALEAQHALERERIRISKDMHDELGASLTKITLLSELAKSDVERPQEIERHLDKISQSTREVATTMDEIVWAVNPKNDRLDRVAAYVLQFAQEYLSMTAIQCHINVPENLPAMQVTAEVRHNIFLVLKESLTNIIHHSGATSVGIILEFQDPVLKIVVRDNGKGFNSDHADPFGNGLINMRKRIEDIGGAFCIESVPNTGTTLTINVRL